MNWIIDLIIIVILLFFFLWGIKKGLIRQILAIVGIVAAFIGAFYLAHHLVGYCKEKMGLPYEIALFVSAVILFIGILVLFHFLGLLLQKISDITLLGPVDRIGGGL
ncbi:MAG: CvpA family protein, partial [Candidatus Krumholzibacteria bacterium]|nr:CvpA family protein [Candidatus Krumholzibacteria bacterium]